MNGPLYFTAIVERLHADHLATGKTEISKDDVASIARAAIRAVGVHIDSVSGQVHVRMRTEPAQQNGVHYRGQKRRRGYRR